MTNTVLIHTQAFENTNVGPNGFGETPSWAPNGLHVFQMELDSDLLLYCDNTAEIFQKMLDREATIGERFEYIDYEIQFQSPTPLGSEELFLELMHAARA